MQTARHVGHGINRHNYHRFDMMAACYGPVSGWPGPAGPFGFDEAPAHPAQQIGTAAGGPHHRQPDVAGDHPGFGDLGVQVAVTSCTTRPVATWERNRASPVRVAARAGSVNRVHGGNRR